MSLATEVLLRHWYKFLKKHDGEDLVETHCKFLRKHFDTKKEARKFLFATEKGWDDEVKKDYIQAVLSNW